MAAKDAPKSASWGSRVRAMHTTQGKKPGIKACGRAALLVALLALSVALAGCTTGSQTGDSPEQESESSLTAEGSSEASDFEAIMAAFDASALDLDYTNRELDSSYDEAAATHIALEGDAATVEGAGAAAEGGVVSISQEGVYVVEGELSSGQLVVDVPDDAKVQVVLAGARISNPSGPCIYVKEADKCFITLANDTENVLADGADYALANGEDEPNATVFSKGDLCFNGEGSLRIDAAYRHAVNSKDDLVITGGSYELASVEDALRGKDCVKINDGDFQIDADGDAVKSSNDADAQRGFVSVTGGKFQISAGDDGLQAATYVRVAGGELSIDATDDALHSDIEALIADGTLNIQAGDDAVHAETVLTIDGGTVDVSSCYEGYEAEKIYLNGGETHILADDDGINAAAADASGSTDDTNAVTEDAAGNAAAQDVAGQEGQTADLGANPAGGKTAAGGDPNAMLADPSAGADPNANGGMGMKGGDKPGEPRESGNERLQDGGIPPEGMAEGGMGASSSDCLIQVNGGYTVVDAAGDGIDSNGSFAMTDGVLLVCGPVNDGNGGFDYDIEATISGGSFLMVGSVGMAQNFTSGEQPFAFATVSGQGASNVAVTDDAGQVLVSFTPQKDYGMVLASAPAFEEGGSYQLVIGGEPTDANDDGYAEGGTLQGGSASELSASTTPTQGFGGLGQDGNPMEHGQRGRWS